MGLLESATAPLAPLLADRGTGFLLAAGLATFVVLATVLNVLLQLLPRSASEPPVVFHWFPIIGNTVTYGMAPYDFFQSCREKVGGPTSLVVISC